MSNASLARGSTGSVTLRIVGAVRTTVLLAVRGTGARFAHRSGPSSLLVTRELIDSPEKAIVISRPDQWFDLKYIPTASRVSKCSTCLYSSHRERTSACDLADASLCLCLKTAVSIALSK